MDTYKVTIKYDTIKNELLIGYVGPDRLMAEHILHFYPIIIMHICNLFKAMATHNEVPDDSGFGIIISLLKIKRRHC